MISIFTPTHDTKFLAVAYRSLCHQTLQDWEWIVLLNGDAHFAVSDARVKVVLSEDTRGYVGALKAEACSHCTGDILLELDHDDYLLPTALEEVQKTFDRFPHSGFVYSNSIHVDGQGNAPVRYSEEFGWQYRKHTLDGKLVDEFVSFPPRPESVSRIWYTPNHLRAFRRITYEAVGGYNTEMRVLDDLDLMCRLYRETVFRHIDKPLYVYVIHGENTFLKAGAEIQQNVGRIHHQYIQDMADFWAMRKGLYRADLGGRFSPRKGYTTVDLKDADIVGDLNGHWPFADNSVGVIRAYDVFEHLKDPLHTMKELHRVLAPGGHAFIQVPSTDGRGAFQDPTHVSFWNENSFFYYTNTFWAKYIDTPVRFQNVTCYTTEWDVNKVCWVRAHLIKLDAGERVCGKIEI